MRVGSSCTQADSYKMLPDIKSGLEVSFSFTGDRMFQSICVSQALFEILIYGEKHILTKKKKKKNPYSRHSLSIVQ